jgi:UDP-N-acetylmuramate--alanine ligase
MIYPKENMTIHFIGIGGIGMSGIAEILLNLGYSVTGSDISESATVNKLRDLGAKVYIGHSKENVRLADLVVYSSAIKEENPEIVLCHEKKIPLMKRAEMIAEIMRLKYGVAVAGTHGKTTTTSMLATILQESKKDPTYIIGGIVKNLNGHAKVGGGEVLVVEADESDGSFLLFNPIMSVVTNIDHDHMDFYETEEKLLKAFERFINKVPFYGLCSLNVHDKRLMSLKNTIKKPYTTFGIETEGLDPDYCASSIELNNLSSSYKLLYKGEHVTNIKINIPGEHNILNSLAAISMAHQMKLSFEEISSSIASFHGVDRRMNQLFCDNRVEVIDDYAHHPTEISETLKAIKKTRGDSNIVVVFEPHRYSRTRDCWNQFLHCFNEADLLLIRPLYPASEKEIPGINSERLIKDINKLHPDFAGSLKSFEELKDVCKKSDKVTTILTLGAGKIGKDAREWIESFSVS